jgi:hypothetical protein
MKTRVIQDPATEYFIVQIRKWFKWLDRKYFKYDPSSNSWDSELHVKQKAINYARSIAERVTIYESN